MAISTRCKGWGGFGFYFLGTRATAYAKHPDDKAWLFDADTMKPRVNNPAWVRAIQDVLDCLPSEPADQLNADPGTTGFQQFLAGTGSMLSWWGDIGSNVKTNDTSVVGDVIGFSTSCPARTTSTTPRPARGTSCRPARTIAPNMAYIGWGIYVMARVDCRREEAEGGLVARGPSRRQGHLAVDGGLSVGLPALPQEPLQHSGVGGGGLRRGLHQGLPRLQADSYNHPNAAIEPRIPGIFQYYSVAEDELAKIYAGQTTAQETVPTPSPPPGRRSPTRSAATTRSSSTRPRSACKLEHRGAGGTHAAGPFFFRSRVEPWQQTQAIFCTS